MAKKKKRRNRTPSADTIRKRHKLKWFDLMLDEETDFLPNSDNNIMYKDIETHIMSITMKDRVYWVKCRLCERVREVKSVYMGTTVRFTENLCPVCQQRIRVRAKRADREKRDGDGNPRSLKDTLCLQGPMKGYQGL